MNVVFDDFRDQGIHRASACSHCQKNRRAFILGDQGFLDRVKLSADSPNAMQQFHLVSNCVCHSLRSPKPRYTPPGIRQTHEIDAGRARASVRRIPRARARALPSTVDAMLTVSASEMAASCRLCSHMCKGSDCARAAYTGLRNLKGGGAISTLS